MSQDPLTPPPIATPAEAPEPGTPPIPLPGPERPAVVEAIIIYKLVKAAVSVLVGILALATLGTGAEALAATLAQVLLDHVTHAWALQLATLIVVAGTTIHLRIAAIAAFADGALSTVEGLALRAGHWWAPWLVVIATGALLPWELLELFKHPQWGRLVILALNLSVVGYLLMRVMKEHRQRAGT
jgi:uncharacterized membrane protein (DUF2068 family)